jgi:uncharacterized iron-regulated protein
LNGPISFEALLEDLTTSRVVYVGETHTDPEHHKVQLQIIEALNSRVPNLAVGMEMFAFPYQPVLDQWSNAEIDAQSLIEKTHWYANWRFPFDLYRSILDTIQQQRIPLVGLNIPFHIPAKVRVGGLQNLLDSDKAYLPAEIDTQDPAHKAYVEPIFQRHNFNQKMKFEYFYEAQCLWEDTMAESIARHLKDRSMVVLVGNGHIIYKFGIPYRAGRRTGVPFRTIYLTRSNRPVENDVADYIWITPNRGGRDD